MRMIQNTLRTLALKDRLVDPSLIKEAGYINGEWRKLSTMFDVIDPATQDVIARVSDYGEAETTDAIKAAQIAFKTWKKTTAEERRSLLLLWSDLIKENLDDLAIILTSEQGKPLKEALGELSGALTTTAWMGEEARRIDGAILPTMNDGERYMVIKQPVGVCAAITPWNFPAAMITRKIAPALAAGCTIVLKPSEETPLIALALTVLAERAGFPKGVINILPTNNAKAVGDVLCESKIVRKLSFTGSTPVGKLLYKQCGDSMKKLSLELGGNAPYIIFNDADLDKAMDDLAMAKFRNGGQTCICPNRIFVHDVIYDDFVAGMKKRLSQVKTGHGLDGSTTLGPLINQKSAEKTKELVQDALDKGAELLTNDEGDQNTCFVKPMVILNADKSMRFFKEEIFGPVAPVYRFNDEETVIDMANDTDYGLAGYCYTKDLARAFRVSEGIEYGMVGVNVSSTAKTPAPFGGMKESGIGREGGRWGIEEFVETKFICLGL